MVAEDPTRMTAAQIARYIDHTLLKSDATRPAFDKVCAEALRYNFKAVCINSGWVAYVAEKLKGTEIAVCSVIGFPLGAMHSRAKAFEAQKAIEDGAGAKRIGAGAGMAIVTGAKK